MNSTYRISYTFNSSERNQMVETLSGYELKNFFSERGNGMLSFLFLREYVLLVESKIALLLTKKNPNIHIIDCYGNELDKHDYLDEITGIASSVYKEILQIAKKYEINFIGKSIEELKIEIRAATIFHKKKANLKIA